MTTTTAATQAITPAPADIAEFRQQLDSHGQYAFATGYLGSVIQGIAEDHRCRKAGCMTCDRLRRGLALIAALDAFEAEPQAGGAS